MRRTPVYQLSGRQILVLSLASAFIAIGLSAVVALIIMSRQSADPSAVIRAESAAPNAGISDPSTVSDEQNNIEVYKTLAPGVAFINTTSYQQDFWGNVQEGKGNGSGSVIDANGDILTNYHVIEGAQKLSVSFGGDKTYPAKVIGGDPDTDLAVIRIDSPPTGLTVIPPVPALRLWLQFPGVDPCMSSLGKVLRVASN